MTGHNVTAAIASEGIRVPVRLEYKKLDPYAVHLWVELTPRRWTAFGFARDVLAGGLIDLCGELDATVEPHPKMSTLVRVTVSNEDVDVTLHFHLSDLADFLDSTYEQMPLGEESKAYTDARFERGLRQLLEMDAAGDGVE